MMYQVLFNVKEYNDQMSRSSKEVKMKYLTWILMLALIAVVMTGCGHQTETTIIDRPVYVPTPEIIDEIKAIIDDENQYRLGLGQTVLSSGLSCTVQQIASGSRISSSSNVGLGPVITMSGPVYSYLYKGSFNQPSANSGPSNLLPSNIGPLFVGINYLIRCQGQIVITNTDYYNFSLDSDDGSLLYIDGTTVINNDGNHGMTITSGSKYLRKGVHTFKILKLMFSEDIN